MYGVAANLDTKSYYRLARATFAEMALAGIGVVGEFHYVHHRPGGDPYDAPNAFGESLVAAARDAGVRLTLLDTHLHGGLSPGSGGGSPAQRRGPIGAGWPCSPRHHRRTEPPPSRLPARRSAHMADDRRRLVIKTDGKTRKRKANR